MEGDFGGRGGRIRPLHEGSRSRFEVEPEAREARVEREHEEAGWVLRHRCIPFHRSRWSCRADVGSEAAVYADRRALCGEVTAADVCCAVRRAAGMSVEGGGAPRVEVDQAPREGASPRST